MEKIKIGFNENDLICMEPEEKINTLVRLSVSTYQQVGTLNKLIVGNGDPQNSVCGRLDNLTTRLNILWGVVLGAGTVIVTVIGIIKFIVSGG